MKYIYRLQHQYVEKLPTMADAMREIAKATADPNYKPNVSSDPIYEDIIMGGLFDPEDGETQLLLTPEEVINRNKDMVNANLCYLAMFTNNNDLAFGGNDTCTEEYQNRMNYIGPWTQDIEDNANIYYFLYGPQIRKIIFVKGLSPDIFGINYITEDEGKMVYCSPDEGDILFDNLEEALNYIKEQIDKQNEIFIL